MLVSQHMIHRNTKKLWWHLFVLFSAAWVLSYCDQGRSQQPSNPVGMVEPWESISNKWSKVPLPECKEAALNGDVKAMYFLGRSLFDGIHTATNQIAGFKWMKLAAEKGLAESQNRVGWLYDNGIFVPRDTDEAWTWVRRAADQGLAKAQLNLGIGYAEGGELTQDPVEGAKWLRKAAEQGLAQAQNRLGWLYEKGEGVQKDRTQAIAWIQKAAEQGHTPAMMSLGWINERWEIKGCCYEGRYEEAAKWYEKAAKLGMKEAAEALGGLYRYGKLGQARSAEAAKWYAMAGRSEEMDFSGINLPTKVEDLEAEAEKESVGVQWHLAEFYAEGTEHVPLNLTNALKWYCRVVENTNNKGNLFYEAALKAGAMFATGHGTRTNYAEAFNYYSAADHEFYPQAGNALGYLYATGRGVERDDEEAAQHFFNATSNVMAHTAKANWAYMMGAGRGTTQNWAAATQIFRSLVNLPEAAVNLALCTYRGLGTKQDSAEAAKLFRQGARMGDAQAQYNLGICYFLGTGIRQDDLEAYTWFHLASEQDYPHSVPLRERVSLRLSSAQIEKAKANAKALGLPKLRDHWKFEWYPTLRFPDLDVPERETREAKR